MSIFDAEVNRLVVRDAAAQLLRQAILEGRLQPGDPLKGELLARELGISRTPIREALVILEAEGLVEATPNRSPTVRTYDAEDLVDLFQLRALLEGYAVRRAATRVTADDLALLWESCDRYDDLAEDEDQLPQLVKENYVFHELILTVAGNRELTEFARQVIALPFVFYGPRTTSISAHYHRQIAAALASRDGERAEMIMKQHILEASDVSVDLVRQLSEHQELEDDGGHKLIIQSDRKAAPPVAANGNRA